MTRMPLDEPAIRAALAGHPRWSLTDGELRASFQFENFSAAFAFMTRVALLAETADHHPDWSNSYDTVDIALKTHSQGRVTQKDVDLALAIERLLGV